MFKSFLINVCRPTFLEMIGMWKLCYPYQPLDYDTLLHVSVNGLTIFHINLCTRQWWFNITLDVMGISSFPYGLKLQDCSHTLMITILKLVIASYQHAGLYPTQLCLIIQLFDSKRLTLDRLHSQSAYVSKSDNLNLSSVLLNLDSKCNYGSNTVGYGAVLDRDWALCVFYWRHGNTRCFLRVASLQL